jgi:hypothetical protein
VLCDTQIRELVGIEPFEDSDKRKGRVSQGLSSYGYEGGKYQAQAGPAFPRGD